MKINKRTQINEFGLPNIVIPAEVIFNDNLTWREKGLFGFINNLASNQEGYCWATNCYLGRCIEVRPETISAMISKLHNEGYLTLEYETRYDGIQIRKVSIDLTYPQKYKKTLQEALRKIKSPIKHILKTPKGKNENQLSKTLSNIESNIENDIETSLSKDNVMDSENPFNDTISFIINFWNNLSNTTTHSKTDTKVFKTISLQIENLLSGKPLIRKNNNSPTKPFSDFLTEFNILSDLHTKYWIENEITNILQIIHDEKHEQSTKLSLDSVFWNRFAKRRGGGFSLFLHTAAQIKIPNQYLDMAIKLAGIIRKRLKPSDKKIWAQDLQKWIESENIEESEINTCLDWYEEHRNEKYIPIIDCAQELQEKYSRLKQAIERSKESKSPKIYKNQPKQPPPNPTHESLNLFPKEKVDFWTEEYKSLTDLWASAYIWPPNYRPNKDKIYSALLELKIWHNNMIITSDPYSIRRIAGSLRIVCNEYIEWIEEQSWLEEGIKEGSLFPSSSMFTEHFMPALEDKIMDIPIRSRGWGKDDNLNIENVKEIREREKRESEQQEERIRQKKIYVGNKKANILWMHSCMKKHLLDLGKTNIDNIDISKWEEKDKLDKKKFEQFVITIEKEHQKNPANRGNSYQFLFLKNQRNIV